MGRSLQWFFVAAPLAGQSIMGVPTTDLETKLPVDYPYGPQAPVLPVPKQLPPFRFIAIPRSFLGVLLALVFVAGNFAVAPLTYVFRDSEWGVIWVFLFAGAILAQVGLLHAVFVFGHWPFWPRAAVCWSVALVLFACWLQGFVLEQLLRPPRSFLTNMEIDVLQFITFSIPLVALAGQSPLWFFRVYLGWRFVKADRAEREARPLSIGDYFSGTAIAAVCIALAQVAPQPGWIDAGFWPRWGIVFASVAGVSLACVIPALLLMFRCRDWRVGLSLLIAYGLLAGIVTVSIFIAFDPGIRRGLSPSQVWEATLVVFMFAAFAVFLGAGMKAMRDMGYSLALGRADGR
jgi:hypothetical protein